MEACKNKKMTMYDTLIVIGIFTFFGYLILARLKKKGYDVADYIKSVKDKFGSKIGVPNGEIKQQVYPEKVI